MIPQNILETLSLTELQVLKLKAELKSTKEIAIILKVKPTTVYTHIERIRVKTGQNDLRKLYNDLNIKGV